MCDKKFENYTNIFSTQTAPIVANINELFPMTKVSTRDWKLDKDDKNTIICKNKGVWTFNVQYQMTGVVNKTGLGLTTMDMTLSPNGPVFGQSSGISLGASGPPPFPDTILPQGQLTGRETEPVMVNLDPSVNIPLPISIPAAFISGTTRSLVGTIYTSNNLSGTITAWIRINNIDIKNTGTIGSVTGVNNYAVLTFSFTLKFKKNDRLSFGIRSDSRTSAPTQVCQGKLTSAGVYAPSMSVTAIKH